MRSGEYILEVDKTGHKGITCFDCGDTTWDERYADARYCPTCKKALTKDLRYPSSIFGKLYYQFCKQFRKEILYAPSAQECDFCDNRDVDEFEVEQEQNQVRRKLIKAKDPKKRAEIWLQSLSK